jgi:hypothetical protein
VAVLKQITQYVKNTASGFTIGTNLFAADIPVTITGDAVVIRETGGAPNFYLRDQVEKSVQVLSRASDYWVASANAKKVYDVLHGIAGITLPVIDALAYYINTAEAVTAPQDVGKDEKGLFNISTNYIVRIQNV